MAENGATPGGATPEQSPELEIVIRMDPATGRVKLKTNVQRTGPESDRVMFNMLTSALGLLFQTVSAPVDQRAVKTLDELGVKRHRRFRS